MSRILTGVVLAVMLTGGTQVGATEATTQSAEAWDDLLKPEAADLSPTARNAFRDALLACSLYGDSPREKSLELRCKQKIEFFRLDFGKRYPLIANGLQGLLLGIDSTRLQEEMGARTDPLKQSLKDFFLDSLEKTYQGSLGATNAETPETAEIICVKYGPCPLNVSAFECTDVTSSFIRRVCYDAPKSFMVIKLKETWYPYCEIDAATVQQLLSAGSAGTFYNDNIRSRPGGAHGPFDCRDHPLPEYP